MECCGRRSLLRVSQTITCGNWPKLNFQCHEVAGQLLYYSCLDGTTNRYFQIQLSQSIYDTKFCWFPTIIKMRGLPRVDKGGYSSSMIWLKSVITQPLEARVLDFFNTFQHKLDIKVSREIFDATYFLFIYLRIFCCFRAIAMRNLQN
jgi:hypothetical protein